MVKNTGWNVEKPMAHWVKPWEPKIQATIHIIKVGKTEAKKQHKQLL
jgi:hypothetical protein